MSLHLDRWRKLVCQTTVLRELTIKFVQNIDILYLLGFLRSNFSPSRIQKKIALWCLVKDDIELYWIKTLYYQKVKISQWYNFWSYCIIFYDKYVHKERCHTKIILGLLSHSFKTKLSLHTYPWIQLNVRNITRT